MVNCTPGRRHNAPEAVTGLSALPHNASKPGLNCSNSSPARDQLAWGRRQAITSDMPGRFGFIIAANGIRVLLYRVQDPGHRQQEQLSCLHYARRGRILKYRISTMDREASCQSNRPIQTRPLSEGDSLFRLPERSFGKQLPNASGQHAIRPVTTWMLFLFCTSPAATIHVFLIYK